MRAFTTTSAGVMGLIWLLVLGACDGGPDLDVLRKHYDSYPEYSILLHDMRIEGNFFKEYYHRYRTVFREETQSTEAVFRDEITDWMRVSAKTYEAYGPFLGMTILGKGAEGKLSQTPEPPGYSYVGDERYGHWQTDTSGNSFWEFYGKYAMMRAFFGMAFGRPIYRNEWNDYQSHRSNGRPYFGGVKQYGTSGTVIERTNPDFFQRRKTLEASRKASFQEKVRSRARRSNMSGLRRRSGGLGK